LKSTARAGRRLDLRTRQAYIVEQTVPASCRELRGSIPPHTESSTQVAPHTTGEEKRPYVLGLGGTTRANSSTERALAFALAAAETEGAETVLLGAADLELPMYAPERTERDERAQHLVAEIARADGLIIASPGYHGGISGLIKNALDYTEDLRNAERPYLDGRAVGCIVCAFGWQATVTTLVSLRSVVHALRGWPTPLGAAINSADPLFVDDEIVNEVAAGQLELVGRQVVTFCRGFAAVR
jgi:FMN reductase